jgi:hypothetical protein
VDHSNRQYSCNSIQSLHHEKKRNLRNAEYVDNLPEASEKSEDDFKNTWELYPKHEPVDTQKLYPNVSNIHLPNESPESKLSDILTNLKNQERYANTQREEIIQISSRLTEMASFISQQNNKNVTIPDFSMFMQELNSIQNKLEQSSRVAEAHMIKYKEIELATNTILAFIQKQ